MKIVIEIGNIEIKLTWSEVIEVCKKLKFLFDNEESYTMPYIYYVPITDLYTSVESCWINNY